jgi:hypothetical protein
LIERACFPITLQGGWGLETNLNHPSWLETTSIRPGTVPLSEAGLRSFLGDTAFVVRLERFL